MLKIGLLILLSILFCILFAVFGGCVTLAKNVYKDNFGPTPTPITSTPTPATPTPVPTPIPTPTIDPRIIFKMQGGLNMGEWYRFTRKTFRDTIDINVTIYRYQIRDRYSLYSPDQDERIRKSAGPGMNFFFIWVRTVSNSTTPLGGYVQTAFTTEFNGIIEGPYKEPGIIYELTGYYDLPHHYQTAPFGLEWGYSYNDTTKTKTREFIELPEFNPGESNAWDGYIIYRIPKTVRIQDIIVHGNFENMFHARWQCEGADKFSLAIPSAAGH